MKKYLFVLWKQFAGVFPKLACEIAFFKLNKKILNLKNPTWFDEKINYLKLFVYAENNQVAKCADKYEVREYVKKHGEGRCLNELYFDSAFYSVDEIPWNELPEKFVVKCTHGCHMNIICIDKNRFDIYEAENNLNKWMYESQWKEQAELHYKLIPPRIIIERYIPFEGESKIVCPVDYKIYCFNGTPKVILTCTNRDKIVKFRMYDIDWNPKEAWVKPEYWGKEEVKKPESLNEMLKICKSLIEGENFPFVRIDFYEYQGKPIFGEMTFTPSGGNNAIYTVRAQEELGDMLIIEKDV